MKIKELDLHITNRCNFNCSYCVWPPNRNMPEMTTEQIKKLISQAHDCGLSDLHINGGEPLLRRDIFEIINFASELGIICRLETNGYHLTREVARQLKNAGLSRIMISLDGSTPEINDSIRGVGTFDRIIKAIKVAKEFGFNIKVNTLVLPSNKLDLPNIAELALSLGVDTYSFDYFSPIGNGKGRFDLWLDPSDWINTINYFRTEVKKRQLLDRFPHAQIIFEPAYATEDMIGILNPSQLDKSGSGCRYHSKSRSYIVIRCDGEAFPCILFVNEPRFLGNVTKDSFYDIWANSEGWERLKGELWDSDCLDCKFYPEICEGGCRGYINIFQSKGKDPRCNKNQWAPICPVLKFNIKKNKFGGASDDVVFH